MDETESRKRVVTRCYIDGDTFILRTLGMADTVVPMPVLSAEVGGSLILEMTARLLLEGKSMADIIAGKAVPDRSLPAGKREKSATPRPLNQIRRAILTVKIGDMTKAAKAGGAKPDRAAIAAQAEVWVRSLTDDQAGRLARAEAVAVELAKLRGTKATLDELLAEPAGGVEMLEAAD